MHFLTPLALAAALFTSTPQHTPDQVRLTYTEAGYIVDAPTRWADGVTMLAIHDPSAAELPGWPTLRAFVVSGSGIGAEEQLLAGYSAPTWHGNVAIVRYDPTAFAPEPDCSPTPVEIRS